MTTLDYKPETEPENNHKEFLSTRKPVSGKALPDLRDMTLDTGDIAAAGNNGRFSGSNAVTWKNLKMKRTDVQKWTSPGGNWITKWDSEGDLLYIGISGQPEEIHGTVEEAKTYIERKIAERTKAR